MSTAAEIVSYRGEKQLMAEEEGALAMADLGEEGGQGEEAAAQSTQAEEQKQAAEEGAAKKKAEEAQKKVEQGAAAKKKAGEESAAKKMKAEAAAAAHPSEPPLLPRGAPDPVAEGEEEMDGVSMEQWRKNMHSSLDVSENRVAGKSVGWRKSVQQSTREKVMERLEKPPSEPLIPLLARKVVLGGAAPEAEEEKPVVVEEPVQGWRKNMQRQINTPKRSKLASVVTDAAALSISRPRGALTARPGLSMNFSEVPFHLLVFLITLAPEVECQAALPRLLSRPASTSHPKSTRSIWLHVVDFTDGQS